VSKPARPTVVASLAPPSRTVVARQETAAAPVPAPRPRDLGDITASIGRGETRALGYAAAPERTLPQFGPIPATHMRITELPDEVRPPQSLPAVRGHADAAQAPARLFGKQAVAFAAELHEPDLYSLRGLVEPARAALRVQFASNSLDAPAAGRFAGPAVVALQTLAFDRGAGIVTGRVTARAN
jgi:hypothetical protein